MLFNSDLFLFAFFPIVWAGWFASRLAPWPTVSSAFLVLVSFAFYGNWQLSAVSLLAGSIVFNYSCGGFIERAVRSGRERLASVFLFAGVVGDLALLGYFKYASFAVETAAMLIGERWTLTSGLLPLGISFFTFTQIAYLADVRYRSTRSSGAIDYALFVSFFPHLLAGPILHHKDMIAQFREDRSSRPWRFDIARICADLVIGSTIFTFGLFKKVVLADSVQVYVGPVFSPHATTAAGLVGASISSQGPLSASDAWLGALAYTLQIYFDFSGYSDMAIGLARTFGVYFPLNFVSPYKATSIIDFWRRWHMTLSSFLRDYLYIPLGGNRAGLGRIPNLMVTMLLGGLWHGAGWTFVLWGALHGFYLVVNHWWRSTRQRAWDPAVGLAGSLSFLGGASLTFLAVVVAWVFFRADTLSDAVRVLGTMFGAGMGWSASMYGCQLNGGACVAGLHPAIWTVGALLVIVFFAPNTQDIMRYWRPSLNPAPAPPNFLKSISWVPSPGWAVLIAIMLGLSVARFGQTSQFLYYRF